MRHRTWVALAIGCVLVWAANEVFAGRGGGGRGGGGGGRGGGGGMRGGGGGMSRPNVNRTPSFSQPARPAARPNVPVNRPAARPAARPTAPISRPTRLPSSRPSTGAVTRPSFGTGTRPTQLPVTGSRIGNRPSTLPSFGAGLAAGAAGAGIANRLADRPTRPSAGQLPASDRRDQLRDRLAGDSGIRDRQRPSQLPERDWGERRQDWSDHRDEIRNEWQERRDEIRDEWQDWHDDYYPWYGGWYWGYSPGYWGWWDPLWDDYPVAATVGLTWWGANAMSDVYGYGSDYYNPYYSDTGVIDYSEPIVTAPEESAANGPSQEDLDKFDQARMAFLVEKYDEALKLLDEAGAKMPHDAVLHEFRSLVLFAVKRYNESASAIHAVLAVGPGWDWKTLSGLYLEVETYTNQLRALEAYCTANPRSADARLLLGYHYLATGSSETALGQFRRASELQPKDSVAASLVRALTPRNADAKPTAEKRAEAAPKTVPTDDVVGTWAATGKGTSKYSMTLDKGGTFTWNFSRGTRKQDVKGVYTVEGNVMAMQPDSGGIMLAELTLKSAGNLHFQMIGGEKNDPGLDFKKSKE